MGKLFSFSAIGLLESGESPLPSSLTLWSNVFVVSGCSLLMSARVKSWPPLYFKGGTGFWWPVVVAGVVSPVYPAKLVPVASRWSPSCFKGRPLRGACWARCCCRRRCHGSRPSRPPLTWMPSCSGSIRNALASAVPGAGWRLEQPHSCWCRRRWWRRWP